MDASKRKRLEAAGFKFGDAADFLELSDAESLYVEVKSLLAAMLQKARTSRRLTQSDVANALGSSQSRVAKMEAGDPSVSLDLLLRSLFVVKASPKEVAKVFESLSFRRSRPKHVATKRASAGTSKRGLARAHT